MAGKTFLPDYGTQRVGTDYRGLFRFFDDDEWHVVQESGAPSLFSTPKEALEAAKDTVRKVLNPPVLCHRSAHRAFIDAAADWFANKHEARAREHTARKRGVRDVVFVEVKGKRNAKNS